MRVIVDTTVISNFASIGQLDVLRPRMERDTGLLGGILLEITVHGLSLLGCACDKLCSLSHMTPRIVSYFFKKLPGAVNV